MNGSEAVTVIWTAITQAGLAFEEKTCNSIEEALAYIKELTTLVLGQIVAADDRVLANCASNGAIKFNQPMLFGHDQYRVGVG
ncbi:MAG: hypothetical protein P4L87_01045 [Formivibrio sp.]|nr:hypothetical protein [Formivibrio sp.]